MKRLFLIVLLFLAIKSHSQDIFYNPVNISPDNLINGVIREGKNGFMWIGTSQGLVRYDGRQFVFYRNDPEDSTSLFDNRINDVLPLDKEIWVATVQGISVLDLETQKFRNYRVTENGVEGTAVRDRGQEVIALMIDDKNEIFIGTYYHGIFRYKDGEFVSLDIKKKNFRQLTPSHGGALNIMTLLPSSHYKDIIWAGTLGGLLKINRSTGDMEYFNYEKPDKAYQIEMNVFKNLYEHDDGLLYCGSWRGIHVFDPKDNSYKLLENTGNLGMSVPTSPIFSILRRDQSGIWITSLSGVHLYSPREKRFTFEKLNNEDNGEFFGATLIDHENRYWLTTINGIFIFDPLLQQFRENSYASIVRIKNSVSLFMKSDSTNSAVWICPNHTDALYKLDTRTGKWQVAPFANISAWKVDRLFSRGFEQVNDHVFAISCDLGVLFYDTQTQLLSQPPGFPNEADQWFGITIDREKNLWVNSSRIGVVRYNLLTHSVKKFDYNIPEGSFTEAFGGTNFASKNGDIFIRRPGGFSVISKGSEEIRDFVYSETNQSSFPVVEAFAEDSHGHVVMSSDEGWIGFVDPSNLQEGVYEKKNIKDYGAKGERIWRMISDSAGDIWAITRRELIKINAADHKPQVFKTMYGARNKYFLSIAALSQHRLAVGDRISVYEINTNDLRANDYLPRPYITKLLVRQEDRSDKIKSLKNSSLQLQHDENFFSFDFSAISYTLGNEVKFRYQLKNFENWQESSAGDRANYTNVPSGNYEFQLQAANNEGIWNPEILSIPVEIRKPWYASLWFIIPVSLFMVLMVYSLYTYRVNQIKQEEQLKTFYEKELAKVEMSSLIAQMNPHFLFNSLNSIESYIIKSDPKKASEYLNNFARLMRLILNNSKSRLVTLSEELEGLQLYLQMESLRFNEKFKYEIQLDIQDDPESVKLPPMIIQPYLENAIWHGLMHKQDSEEKTVKLRVKKEGQKLIIQIEDNGIGRAKAAEIKNRKNKHKESMAMNITRSRIDIINKLYDAEADVQITDLTPETHNTTGTLVEIRLNSFDD